MKNSGQRPRYDFAPFRLRKPVLYPAELRGQLSYKPLAVSGQLNEHIIISFCEDEGNSTL